MSKRPVTTKHKAQAQYPACKRRRKVGEEEREEEENEGEEEEHILWAHACSTSAWKAQTRISLSPGV